jgi:hypothetical protein
MRQSLHDRIAEGVDADGVLADMRVADKMSADHPLVFEVAAEGIAHAAVDSSQAGSAAHGPLQPRALLRRKLAHGPAGRDDGKRAQPLRISQQIQAGDDFRADAPGLQGSGKTCDNLFRMVPRPAALDEERAGEAAGHEQEL